jgi:IS30 family transposase
MIGKGLLDGESFAAIARKIKKHPSTVAKEVKKYRYFPEREASGSKLPCALRNNPKMKK